MSHAQLFGRLELRPAERQALIDGEPVALGARAFDVLQALVERRDRVVSKNELLDLAWPGLVVEENNLSVQISALRKALGAQAIATVTGRGYRFALPEAGHAATQAPSRTAEPATADAAHRITRRMAALVFAEVVEWQAWVARDADAAITSWHAVRREVLEAGLSSAGARTIELAAEGVWLEFASAVDAVRWALELQRRLAERRAAPGAPALHMRLGIHADDFIVDDGKLMGEAARWPAQLPRAAAGLDAVVVSQAVHGLVLHRMPLKLRELERRVEHPPSGQAVPVYAASAASADDEAPGHAAAAVTSPSASATARATPAQAVGLRDLPSIAVLPFASATPDATYFSEGMTEEIVSALAANRGLLVIARNSTLRYRASSAPPTEIARELGVRYLLDGSVQRQASQLRISASLIDAPSGRVIWARHFDGSDRDLFAFQAEIAASIAAAIDPQVQAAEITRVAPHAANAPTDNLSAYDCVLRALAVQYSFRDEDLAYAGQMYRRAIELDPHYAHAHAQLAWWHNLHFGEGRRPEQNDDALASERLSLRAIELDPRDAWALAVAGHVQGFVKKRLSVAMDMFDQALTLNPSCAFAWARSATTLAFMGDGGEAARRVGYAMRLSPFDQQTFTFLTTNGTAAFVLGRFDEAAAWYAKARRVNPGYRAAQRMLVAALALSGELGEARELAAEFMRVEPSFRVDVFISWYPMREPNLGRVAEGMRRAGLPG